MEFLRLSLGLAVPWLGGYFWLRFLEGKLAPHYCPHPLRQLGYGFFLGYAFLALALLVGSAYGAAVSYGPILSALILITLAGMVLALKLKPIAKPTQRASSTHIEGPARLIFYLLLAWLGLHLILSAMEIFMRPVYPWDAWLAWIYRAKAWFYAANVFDLATPEQWLAGGTESPYAIAAADYPDFASLIPFWAATSLGRWSETLINLPVLLCGLALVFGVYGQAREYGMNPLLAALAAYLLISIPLVGTHLSLAGYADIWMAGFTGLGFVALIRGLSEHSKIQVLLGMSMLLLALGVKNEAVVWLYSAIGLIVFTTLRPATTWISLGALTALCLAAWAADMTVLDLPLIGKIGVEDGLVHVPFAGSHQLAVYNATSSYLKAFFAQGSWNVLWTLMLLTGVALAFRPGDRFTRVCFTFFLIVVTGQMFIFFVTEQGRWAESLSAINRLPLHFAPALIFCALGCLHHGMTARTHKPESIGARYAVVPAIAAIIVLALGLALYLSAKYPSTQADGYQKSYSDMRIAMGSGEKRQGELIIDGFRNGGAIVSTGSVSLDASLLTVLDYDIRTQSSKAPAFFWRLAEAPQDLEFLNISGSGPGSLQLASQANWRGRITEAGFILYGDAGNPATVRSLALVPNTLFNSLGVIWSDWLTFEPWSQKSINWLHGGAANQLLSMTSLLSIGLLGVALFYIVLAVKKSAAASAVTPIFICALVVWIIMDMRWTGNRLSQTAETIGYTTARGTRSYQDIGDDKTFEALALETISQLGVDSTTKLVVLGNAKSDDYKLLRIKYHLLPLAAVTRHQYTSLKGLQESLSAIILVDEDSGDPGAKPNAMDRLINSTAQEEINLNIRPIAANSAGKVLEITKVP